MRNSPPYKAVNRQRSECDGRAVAIK